MTPAWRIRVDGADVTARIRDSLARLRLTLTSDAESDRLDLRLTTIDPGLSAPAGERALMAAIGYAGEPLIERGPYYHESTEIDLVPAALTLHATGADLRASSALRTRRTRAWDATTLGAIAQAIADRHGLKLAIDPDLAAISTPHVDQTDEGDLQFLRRLYTTVYDAVVKVVSGRLVITPAAGGRTAVSRTPIPPYRPAPPAGGRSDVLRARVTRDGQERYASVRARYYDVIAAGGIIWRSVVAGEGEPVLALREPQRDRATAQAAAAAAALARVSRGAGTLDLTVVGRPDLAAETPIVLEGWGDFDGAWTTIRATHEITPTTGYTTRLQATTVTP